MSELYYIKNDNLYRVKSDEIRIDDTFLGAIEYVNPISSDDFRWVLENCFDKETLLKTLSTMKINFDECDSSYNSINTMSFEEIIKFCVEELDSKKWDEIYDAVAYGCWVDGPANRKDGFYCVASSNIEHYLSDDNQISLGNVQDIINDLSSCSGSAAYEVTEFEFKNNEWQIVESEFVVTRDEDELFDKYRDDKDLIYGETLEEVKENYLLENGYFFLSNDNAIHGITIHSSDSNIIKESVFDDGKWKMIEPEFCEKKTYFDTYDINDYLEDLLAKHFDLEDIKNIDYSEPNFKANRTSILLSRVRCFVEKYGKSYDIKDRSKLSMQSVKGIVTNKRKKTICNSHSNEYDR